MQRRLVAEFSVRSWPPRATISGKLITESGTSWPRFATTRSARPLPGDRVASSGAILQVVVVVGDEVELVDVLPAQPPAEGDRAVLEVSPLPPEAGVRQDHEVAPRLQPPGGDYD